MTTSAGRGQASDLPAELLTAQARAVVVPDASMPEDARTLMYDQLKAVGFSEVTMLSKPAVSRGHCRSGGHGDPGPQAVAELIFTRSAKRVAELSAPSAEAPDCVSPPACARLMPDIAAAASRPRRVSAMKLSNIASSLFAEQPLVIIPSDPEIEGLITEFGIVIDDLAHQHQPRTVS